MLGDLATTTNLWRRQNSTDPDSTLDPSPDDIASQARIGKAHGPKAAILHKQLQIYVVVPSLIVCVTLGYAAGIVSPKETPLDAHKVFGLIMVVSVIIALATGSYTHNKYFGPGSVKRKKAPMSVWLHVQAGLGFLFSPATQVLSGLSEWQSHVGAPLPWYVPVVAWSLAFFPPSTPREAPDDPEARSLRDNCFDVEADEKKGARPRLKATPTLQSFDCSPLHGLMARRGTQDRTPGSPRSVSSPAAASFSSDSRTALRSPPPPFSPPRGRMSPI
ncbi:hypothetical protein JCM5350_006483 [Sporobolomyces pararoseus]